MSNDPSDNKHAMLAEAEGAPLLKRFGIYTKLSGPGWLQGAITLGGGSLAGALYLGVIAGFGLLWLQPLAMLCGIVMLSAIAYVTLSYQSMYSRTSTNSNAAYARRHRTLLIR